MYRICSMSSLEKGKYGRVRSLFAAGPMRRRLQDIGLTNEAKVKCIGKSPPGDPKAYLIKGAVIAIRSKDSADVIIEIREEDQTDFK